MDIARSLLGAVARNNVVRVVALYVLFYLTKCVRKPDLFYHQKKRASVEKMFSLHRSYYPLFFAPFGPVQTILQLFRKPSLFERTEILIETSHGGSIVLDLADVNKETKRNVLLVHGFNGSGNSSYMRGMTGHLSREGYRVFCFNARGIKSKLVNPIFFHIGWTEDLRVAVAFILDNYAGTLEIFGFSMGANWVTKFFGEERLDPRIIRGGAVCLPFDFAKIGMHFLKNAYTRFYNKLLTRNFVRYMNRNKEMFRSAGYDVEMVKQCANMQQIDLMVTAKIFGIKDVDEYYRDQSCRNYIAKICVPFIILNAYDDPIVPAFSIDKTLCLQNENILLVIAHRGGHLGFLSNRLGRTWSEDVLVDFVRHF